MFHRLLLLMCYVTLYVRVWIEIVKVGSLRRQSSVTLYVRVWIEILIFDYIIY